MPNHIHGIIQIVGASLAGAQDDNAVAWVIGWSQGGGHPRVDILATPISLTVIILLAVFFKRKRNIKMVEKQRLREDGRVDIVFRA